MSFRRSDLVGIVACALGFAFFWYVGQRRLIAQDEGYYALSVALVSDGRIPYRDFFFPQMPLLPYFYALFTGCFGRSWEVLRIVSSLLAGTCGALLWFGLSRRQGALIATLALVAFAASSFSFAWLTPVKTYALSSMLLMAGWLCAEKARTSSTHTCWFWAGLFVGAATCSRLYFVVVAPLFLIWALAGRDRVRAAYLFILGCTVLAVPMLYFVFQDWTVFWFNNLGYHLKRSPLEGSDALFQKSVILRSILGLRSTQQFAGYLFPATCWLTIFAALRSALLRRMPSIAMMIALVLGGASLLPTPIYIQYFVVIFPFTVIASAELLADFSSQWLKVTTLALATIFVAISIPAGLNDLDSFTRTGAGVIGINRATVNNWTVPQVERVSREVANQVGSDKALVPSWPGYAFESEARVVSGFENDFGWIIADLLTEDEKTRYKIRALRAFELKPEEIANPPVMVLENRFFNRRTAKNLGELGYRTVRKGAGAVILAVPEK